MKYLRTVYVVNCNCKKKHNIKVGLQIVLFTVGKDVFPYQCYNKTILNGIREIIKVVRYLPCILLTAVWIQGFWVIMPILLLSIYRSYTLLDIAPKCKWKQMREKEIGRKREEREKWKGRERGKWRRRRETKRVGERKVEKETER